MNSPEELFGAPEGVPPYYVTKAVGFYDGFYGNQGGNAFQIRLVNGEWEAFGERYGDCFFPQVTPAFWESLLREDDALYQILNCHGLALYAGPKKEDSAERLALLLDASWKGEGPFPRAAADLYDVLLLAGHDGQYFEAYARSASDFALLEPVLTDAVRAVEESEWYRSNKGRLVWSEELDACLMLPKSSPAEANL